MNRQERVQKLSYCFYLTRTRKGNTGSELDDWLKAEKEEICKESFFKFIRHPLFLLCVSGMAIWFLQQGYLKNEKILGEKYEIFKSISPLHARYYQESWNQWYAFKNGTPSEKYRSNIQAIVVEAKAIEVQLPILFRDKQIYKNWQGFLEIFWEANYPVSRGGISEDKMNEKLNLAGPLIDDILNRMSRELVR